MICQGQLMDMMEFGKCYEGVTRQREYQPCDKVAVAVKRDTETREPYPVCAYHARGDMVTLTEMYEALS